MSHSAVLPPQSLDTAVDAVRSVVADDLAPSSQARPARGGVFESGASRVDAVRRVRAERGAAAAGPRAPRLAGRAGTTVLRSAGGRLVALPTSRAA